MTRNLLDIFFGYTARMRKRINRLRDLGMLQSFFLKKRPCTSLTVFLFDLLMDWQMTSLFLDDFGRNGRSTFGIVDSSLEDRIFAANYCTDIMKPVVFCTEAMSIILERLWTSEDTTARSAHAQAITDNSLTFA
jgi:hypothetical protein